MHGLTRGQVNLVKMLPPTIRDEVSDIDTFTNLIDYEKHSVADLLTYFGGAPAMAAFCRCDVDTVLAWADANEVSEIGRPRVTEGVIRAHLTATPDTETRHFFS